MSYRVYNIILWITILFNVGIAFGTESGFRATLAPEEIAWLNAHPVIRFTSDPDFTPVEFIDDKGQYTGIAADYLALLSKRLGVTFEHEPASDFFEALQLVREVKADFLPVVVKTPQRAEYLNFTNPYLNLPSAVITARNDVENWSLDTLSRMKVAVVHGFYTQEWLSHEYPDIELVQTPDIQTALLATSFGVADAMVGTLAATSYFTSKMNITNLRVAFQIQQNSENSMGVRRDWPILRQLLDKALSSISVEEKQAITRGWIHLEPPPLWKNPKLRLIALTVLAALIGIILAILVWNRTLTRKVRLRTQALEEAHLRLMQSAKLESVGRLAAGVAHEVKNPLAIIQMGVDYLYGEFPKESEACQVIKDMEDAVQRADGVVKGLLNFSHEKKLSKRQTDLNDVLRDSLKLVQFELNHHNISVEEKLAQELPTINADPDKLKQVFINLFMNAIQAMGREGKLELTSECFRLRKEGDALHLANGKFRPGERVVVIKVDDNGTGIEPEKVEKVFDPFFTTKPVGQGTGLGLSVSRNIIELHGGAINLCNREGGGASVVLIFKTA